MSTSEALRSVATASPGGSLGAPRKTLFDMLQNPKFAKGLGAVASKYLTPDRMLSLCINAVKKTPLLQECNPQSVLGAMMASAALGLEPNTLQQQAFLIPYKRRIKEGDKWVSVYDCQFQVGARGFITLAYRSPLIKLMTAEAIHDGDIWENEVGSKTFLRYAKTLRNRGGLLGSFSYARFEGDGESACVLPLDELMKIRSKSETYRSLVERVEKAENAAERAKAERNLAETPWVMWEDDMVAKSAIKKHAKQLPLTNTDPMAVAAEIDTRADQGIVDMAAFSDPDQARAVMADEAEIPERQAIEHQPSEGLRFPPADEPQAEPVPQAEAKPATKAARGKAAAQAPEQERQAAPKKTYAQLADEVIKARDVDAAAVVLDGARGVLDDELLADLSRVYANKWGTR